MGPFLLFRSPLQKPISTDNVSNLMLTLLRRSLKDFPKIGQGNKRSTSAANFRLAFNLRLYKELHHFCIRQTFL